MIFFDLDGTLFDDDANVRGAVATYCRVFKADLPCDVEAFQVRWREALERWFDRYLRKEISMQEQRRARIREFTPGVSDAEADRRFQVYLDAYVADWRIFDDVLPALDALRDHRLGVITNGQIEQQRSKMTRTGLAGKFEMMVVSEEVGVPKPEAPIFVEACRRAGLPPWDCWYIGDRLATDALAATDAGLRGVWLNRNPAVPSDPRVPTIRSLAELPALVRAA